MRECGSSLEARARVDPAGAVFEARSAPLRPTCPFCSSGDQVRSNICDVMHQDGVGCARVLAAQKELADGAEDLPLLGNALQGMHTEILELDARARD